MLRTSRVTLSLLCLTMMAGAQAATGGSRAAVNVQQSSQVNVTEDVKRGVELYKQGDDIGAIELLRRAVKIRKDMIAAWHFLGLAYERQGKSKDARKAHEQAAKAGEATLEWLFTSLANNKDPGEIEQAKLSLSMAADSAERYLKLSSNPSSSKVEEWNFRSETLRDYAGASTNNTLSTLGKIYKPSDVTTKARVLRRRDEPEYTEEARNNMVAGTVVLRAVIAPDGKLRGIRVVAGLPFGLNMRAIEAARKIKFAPAMLDGTPVSQYIQIEYNFNLY